jgi:hypothetical protein
MQIRRILAPCVAVLIATAPAALAQRNNEQQQQQPPPQRSAAEQQDIQTLVLAVEAVVKGQAAPADIPVTWESNHFIKGQSGETYIPLTLRVDRAKLTSPAARLYIRAVDKNAPVPVPPAPAKEPAKEGEKPAAPAPVMYSWDKIYSVQVPEDGVLSRAIQLKPGEYDLFIAIKDQTAEAPAQGNERNQRNQRNEQQAAAAPAETTVSVGMLRRDLSVPDFTVADLKTSSVILATNVEPTQGQLSPAEQEANPYVFGPMRIVANPTARYSKGGELHVIFWIYGAQAAASGKPDVTIEYNFHQRLAEGEKYFNRTQPQELNAQSLPPEFSVAAGHQLPGSLVVPMSAFPAGEYRLEIKVTDKAANKSVTENVNFTVLPV